MPHSNWCVKKRQLGQVCFELFAFFFSSSPQKNSCLTACFCPLKAQCIKDMKGSLLFICTYQGCDIWILLIAHSLSTPEMSPGTTYTVHLGVILKWKGMLTNQLCIKWLSDACFSSVWAAQCFQSQKRPVFVLVTHVVCWVKHVWGQIFFTLVGKTSQAVIFIWHISSLILEGVLFLSDLVKKSNYFRL